MSIDVIKIIEKEGVFTLYIPNQILYEFLTGNVNPESEFEIKKKSSNIETLIDINKKIKDRLFYGRRTNMINFTSTYTQNLFSEFPEFHICRFSKKTTPFKGNIFSDHFEDTKNIKLL